MPVPKPTLYDISKILRERGVPSPFLLIKTAMFRTASPFTQLLTTKTAFTSYKAFLVRE